MIELFYEAKPNNPKPESSGVECNRAMWFQVQHLDFYPTLSSPVKEEKRKEQQKC